MQGKRLLLQSMLLVARSDRWKIYTPREYVSDVICVECSSNRQVVLSSFERRTFSVIFQSPNFVSLIVVVVIF